MIPNRALNRFVWLTATATLFLICSGGMVTSKGVGLAVPDWPSTFGYNMFLFPFSQWVGGIFFEHTHRLIASAVGLLTVILALWLWRTDPRRWMRALGWIALGVVVFQGVLGGLRVTMLKDEIGIFHACLAQAFLGLLVFIGLATSRFWESAGASAVSADPRGVARRQTDALRTAHATAPLSWTAPLSVWLPIAITLSIFAQLALGATMRHQHRDLAILDFPLAYGRVIPDVSADSLVTVNRWREARALSEVTAAQIWLQMAHRFGALVIAAGVIGYWFWLRGEPDSNARLKILSTWWVIFLVTQITLGAWTIWSNKAADIATAHVAVGATMLTIGIALSACVARFGSVQATAFRPQEARQPEEAHAL